MHSRNGNIKRTTYSDANDFIEKLFHALRSKYEDGLETSMEGSDFFLFNSSNYMYHKVTFKRCGSYIDSPDWIKKNKATINPKNKDDKYFQNAATVALNYEKITWNSERVSNIKPLINKYNWEKIIHQK